MSKRSWRTGKVVNVGSRRVTAGIERRFYHIDTGEHLIYVGTDKGRAVGSRDYAGFLGFGLVRGKSEFAKLTVGGPVRFAIEGDSIFLLDERSKEVELKFYSKIRKSLPAGEGPTATPAAPERSPTRLASSGEIRRGMTWQEVEKTLGKPLRP